jgi:hypothetical protein
MIYKKNAMRRYVGKYAYKYWRPVGKCPNSIGDLVGNAFCSTDILGMLKQKWRPLGLFLAVSLDVLLIGCVKAKNLLKKASRQ